MMKNVLLSLKSLVLVVTLSVACCQMSFAQSASSVTSQGNSSPISGVVTDETGAPLAGAAVMIEGTTVGVSTGVDGEFSINASTSDKLVFSYVGYTNQVLPVGAKTTFNVKMDVDSQQLEEVVVVGFGTQKKVNLSGSVVAVGSEVLEDRPVANVGSGLQGVIPNLNIDMNSTGDPTASPSFNIRGTTSISGGDPLVLVDGIEMNVNDMNPNDIKSVTVLKDAGAAAIYGARAAFGVILIETKTADENAGKPRIQFSAEYGLNQPIFNLDQVTDPYEYATLRNAATYAKTGSTNYSVLHTAAIQAYSEDPVNNPSYIFEGGVYKPCFANDYYDLLIAPVSPQQKYDISMSGAANNNKYYVSLGFYDQDGMYNGDGNENYQRINAILKNDMTISKWLVADSKVVFNSTRSDKVHDTGSATVPSAIGSLYRMSPLQAIQMPAGVEGYEDLAGEYFYSYNYLSLVEKGGRDLTKDNTIVLSQGLTATPMEGLKIRGEFSYKSQTIREDNASIQVGQLATDDLDAGLVYYGDSATDYVQAVNSFDQYYTFNTYAEYSKQFGKHDLKGMVGYNYEAGLYQSATATGYTLASNSVTDVDATIGTQTSAGGQSEIALMGVFYRFNYSYDDRYLLELNGRYDGTSRFPSDSRYGFFPSFSAAWRISEEQFMESTRGWLDNLKLRASYGELGNQAVSSYYPYLSTMAVGSNYAILSAGSTYTTEVDAPGLVAPTLTWESVSTLNFGIDVMMFKNKLNLSFDKYTRDTKDMLMTVSYPSILGTDAPEENGADLRTNGWEFSATYRGSVGRDFNYGITVGLSDYTSKITKYNNPSGDISTYYEGQTIGEIWGYETVGIFQTDEEAAAAPDQSSAMGGYSPVAGDIQYADLNNDGYVNTGSGTLSDTGDQKVIGNTTPRYSYSFNIDLNYKSFGLTAFFQGVGKCDYMPTWVAYDMFYPYSGEGILKSWVDDCWSEDNPDAYFARPLYNDGRNYAAQSRYLQDASYLRLKSLVLSYKLPQKFLDKCGIANARISVSGTNLLTFSSIREPLDPEYSLTRLAYPLMKTYSMSLSLTL